MKKKTFAQRLLLAMTADEHDKTHPLMLLLGQLINIIIVVALAMLCCLIMGSCKTIHDVQTVYVHTTDTLMQTVNTRDSIYLHDSIHVKEWQKGDTIYIDRYKQSIEYVDRIQHDSIYINRTDTIYRDREKVVEKKPSWWQRVKQTCGYVAMVLLLVMLATFLIKRWHK